MNNKYFAHIEYNNKNNAKKTTNFGKWHTFNAREKCNNRYVADCRIMNGKTKWKNDEKNARQLNFMRILEQ